MKKIVVFGSINTDLVITTNSIPENGETIKGKNFKIFQGGKGANQAVAASKLGASVQMIGSLANDSFGRDSLISLKKHGVETAYVKLRENVSSGVAVILKTQSNGLIDNRIIIDPGSNDLVDKDQLLEYSSNHECNGSIFICQLEINPVETYKALEIAKKLGMITILNPAPAIEIPSIVYKDVDILIVNETEAFILSGISPKTKSDELEIYEKFKLLGVYHLILTLGPSGSVIFTDGITERIAAHKVEVVDTTGAGDAYIGALSYKLSLGDDLITAARFASIASSLAVTKEGATDGMPDLEEVNNFMCDGIKL